MFRPISTKRRSELAAEQIKKAILSRHFKFNEKLPSERDLSLQMQVGRSVIREALRTLENSGFILTKQGVDGGSFVRKPDATILSRSFADLICLGQITIEQLTEARLLIEREVLQLAIKRIKTQNDFKPADDIINSAIEKLDRQDPIREENFAFHRVIAEFSANPILIMVMNSILPIISRFVSELNPPVDHSREILEGHRKILEEMKSGNTQAAVRELEDHIYYFAKEFSFMAAQGIDIDLINP